MARLIPSICDGNVAYIPPQEGDCTLIEKSITENGIYRAFDDGADGYSVVTANVPNSYEASDEGKVVSNGELVAQTGTTVTENGTYDTTENNEVVVNVSGGSAVVEPLSVTQNGTYTPPSGVDGYAPVAVNVSGGGDDDEPIPSIPPEYQKVEYIHIGVSNANQYITLPSVDAYSTLKVRFRPLAAGEYPILAAKSGESANTQDDFELYFGSNRLVARLWVRDGSSVDFFSAKCKGSYPQPVANTEPTLSNTEIFQVCEIGVKHAYPSEDYPNETIKIGYYLSGLNYRGYCYYVKVTAQSDDSLEYFLVPCYRKSDGVIGFYDTVNGVFYTNEGSGLFGKGADVN